MLKNVDRMLHVPICYTLTPWDVRSEVVRTRETAFGNLVADALFGGYAEVSRAFLHYFFVPILKYPIS